VVGEVRDSQTGVRLGKQTNQTISQWPHGQFARSLSEKAARLGIAVEWIDETYSTKTCSVSGHVQPSSPRGARAGASGRQWGEQQLLESGVRSLQQGASRHRHVAPPHRRRAPDTDHKSLAHARTSQLQPGECQRVHVGTGEIV
jgi:hypothetical protein